MKRMIVVVGAFFALPTAAIGQGADALDVAMAIDGASGRVCSLVFQAGPRAAPDVIAVPYFLPPTVSPGPDAQAAHTFQVAGYVGAAPAGLLSAPDWQVVGADSEVCAFELVSLNASALRVQLTGDLPDRTELRVFDPVSGFAFGPYRWLRRGEHSGWWSTIIFGDRIGLEFRRPLNAVPGPLPAVSAIAHVYDAPDALRGGCTHVDATCEPTWADAADAVTMLSFISGGSVVGFCSGAMLNREPGDFSPLVMTANHCVGGNGGQATADSTAFVFLFETAACNGAPPNPNALPRSNGALIVKRHRDSDWNLLGLYEPPGTSQFLGWNSGDWSSGADAIGIHHPAATFRRISIGTNDGSSTTTFCAPGGVNCFDAEVWDVEYTQGFTEPGSSGSPVLGASARVRGTLSGGPDDDCTVSQYGRFDLAYTNLKYFLSESSIASPVYVDGAVAGDTINNGDSERGTAGAPFNSVHEATFAVRAGDTVRITPGVYDERFRLWRPMTLKCTTVGTVRIGD